MIVELPDKKMSLEFPDDMPQEAITKIIQEQVYGVKPEAAAPSAQESPSILSQLGQGMINQLPAAGMVLGGTGGGLLGAMAGGIGAVPGGAAGAGLGAGIGQAAKGYLQEALGIRPPQLPMQNIQDITKEGMMATTSEAAGPLVGKVLQKVTSPFANYTAKQIASNSATKAAQELVEQQGAAISPDVIAPSRTARAFNWLAERVWPASSIMANRRQGLQTLADDLKSEFVASRGLFDTSRGGVDQAWENWVKLAGGPEARYPMPETTRILQDLLTKPQGKFGTLWKQHVPAFLEGKTIQPLANKEIETLGTEISGLGETIKSNPLDIFSVVKKEMLENKIGQNKGVQDYSVQAVRDLFNVLNPSSVKGAARTARMKVADAIMNDLSMSGNPEMVEALSAARELSRVQKIAAPLQRIFMKSTIEATKAGEENVFSPSRFVNNWNNYRGSFVENKNYSAEDIRVIDAFADKMKAVVPDLSRAAKFNPPLSLGGVTQLNLENPLAVGYGISKAPALAVPVGLDAMLARSLMSPNGIMRRFLTTGFGPPTLSSKVGLMNLQEELQK